MQLLLGLHGAIFYSRTLIQAGAKTESNLALSARIAGRSLSKQLPRFAAIFGFGLFGAITALRAYLRLSSYEQPEEGEEGVNPTEPPTHLIDESDRTPM